MEEILDPKKPWNIACAAWGIHLKKEPATNRLQPGGLRSSTERATRELAETSPYGLSRLLRDCFCAFISSSTNKKDSVVCSLNRDHSSGLECGVESLGKRRRDRCLSRLRGQWQQLQRYLGAFLFQPASGAQPVCFRS